MSINRNFYVQFVAGLAEVSTPASPYASCTYAQITAANPVLNTNRWEFLYDATEANDKSLKITGDYYKPLVEGDEKAYFGGRVRQPKNYRRSYEIESQPIYYVDTAYPYWDVSDMDTFIRYFRNAAFLWANIRTPRMTGTEYIPVVIRDWQITDSPENGTKRLQFTLVHAFANL